MPITSIFPLTTAPGAGLEICTTGVGLVVAVGEPVRVGEAVAVAVVVGVGVDSCTS